MFFRQASIDALRSCPLSMPTSTAPARDQPLLRLGSRSAPNGIGVPVLRNADSSACEIELGIADLATAPARRLELSELTGRVHDLQRRRLRLADVDAILNRGLRHSRDHAIIKRRWSWTTDRDPAMMYLAVSYDHRRHDGRESVTFLKRIKECSRPSACCWSVRP